jgi:hypothetical protein
LASFPQSANVTPPPPPASPTCTRLAPDR